MVNKPCPIDTASKWKTKLKLFSISKLGKKNGIWLWKISCYTFICYNWDWSIFLDKFQVYIDTLELKFYKKSLKLRSYKRTKNCSFCRFQKLCSACEVAIFALHYFAWVIFCLNQPHFYWGQKFHKNFSVARWFNL